MAFDTELIAKSREYAEQVLANGMSKDFHYHNLEHTESVAAAAEEIGQASDLNDEELEIVIVSAWFHDVGYRHDRNDHEEESVRIAKQQLSDWGMAEDKVDRVAATIEATRMPQSPKDALGEVLCDADLYHLSTSDFEKYGESLRQEFCDVRGEKYTDEEWLEENRKFFKEHQYFTNYGQTILEPRKKKNIKKIKKKQKKEDVDISYVEGLEDQVIKLKNKMDKDKARRPDRGIETMFRITSKNHLELSAMADNKANIMISINSIILSVMVSVLFRKLEDYPNLIIPTLLLVIVCLTTIVFAVLATRPNISSGKFTREDIANKSTNLLFFGNFHSMKLENYMWGMKEMMKDGDFLYGSLIKDIYFLGIVLGKKYKMLRTSYTIFMYGFVISILSFILAMIFFTPIEHY
ncbi:MAG: Pycsar system effector family protein [Bacteroidota bacterium]